MTEPTRILVVDDHPAIREGIVSLIQENPEFIVCGEARHGEEALELMESLPQLPRVVLMDMHMPVMDGVDCTRELVRRYGRQTGVLVLSMENQAMYIRKMLQAGASGYILKDCDKMELYAAIESVSRGNTHFSPALSVGIDEINPDPEKDKDA